MYKQVATSVRMSHMSQQVYTCHNRPHRLCLSLAPHAELGVERPRGLAAAAAGCRQVPLPPDGQAAPVRGWQLAHVHACEGVEEVCSVHPIAGGVIVRTPRQTAGHVHAQCPCDCHIHVPQLALRAPRATPLQNTPRIKHLDEAQ